MKRTKSEIREHYLAEKKIANRLRNSKREDRIEILRTMYDELFEKIPHHPRLNRADDPDVTKEQIDYQLSLIRKYLSSSSSSSSVMEVGCGDCNLSLKLSTEVDQVYGFDISDNLVPEKLPSNFEFRITDGIHFDIPDNSVDLVYSNQLMEHLHPEDAIDQLREIYRIISPGGYYICITPNRVSGPHDVSKYFDEVATCFHLKEYTTKELKDIFEEVGFDRFRVIVGPKKYRLTIFAWPSIRVESFLMGLPYKLRKKLAKNLIIRQFIGRSFVGIKQE